MAVQPKPMRPAALRATSSRRAAATPPDVVQTRSGADRGVGLMLGFTAATLLIVVAVTVVGIVDRWWVLIPVMLVDFAVTFGVIASIGRLLGDEGEPQA